MALSTSPSQRFGLGPSRSLGSVAVAGALALLSQNVGCAATKVLSSGDVLLKAEAPVENESNLAEPLLDANDSNVSNQFAFEKFQPKCSDPMVDRSPRKPGSPIHDIATTVCDMFGQVSFHRICEAPKFEHEKLVGCASGWVITVQPQNVAYGTFELR